LEQGAKIIYKETIKIECKKDKRTIINYLIKHEKINTLRNTCKMVKLTIIKYLIE